MSEELFRSASEEREHEQTQWMPVSDLMAGLMMVFLFISVALMHHVQVEKKAITDVAETYRNKQQSIVAALVEEFELDLASWGAEIDEETLTITFQSPDINFARGSTRLTQRYRDILADFFPRYMNALDRFHNDIDEIRIEGHTSSRWRMGTSTDESYFLNMNLSQGRTRAVLNFVYNLPEVVGYRPWIKSNIAAVGLSSSKPKIDSQGREDPVLSRRVTFRVISNADSQIRKILNLQGG